MIFHWTVMIADLIVGIFILLCLVALPKMRHFPTSHKFGLWLGAAGLLSQSMWSALFIFYGQLPSESHLPMFVLKDACFWVISFFVVLSLIKHKRTI